MKGYKERLIVLSFPTGCLSGSSVEIGKSRGTKSKSERIQQRRGERRKCKETLRRFMARSFKIFSHIFVNNDDDAEEEREMEIGNPTDVKHLTHIGLDGKITTTEAPKIMSLPSMSLRQFEIAMSAQSTVSPSVLNSTKL